MEEQNNHSFPWGKQIGSHIDIKVFRSVWKKTLQNKLLQRALSGYGKIQHKRILNSASRIQNHHYTCFFRSPLQLEALTGPVLKYLTQTEPRRQIKIVIFGCSNGAEPYTIASFLMRSTPDVNFHIMASDFDPEVIQKATTGEYTKEEVGKKKILDKIFREFTFNRDGEIYSIKPSIRSRVSFYQSDVLYPDLKTIAGEADIVFAQNLFFHIDPGMVPSAFQNVYQVMKPRAVLFVDGMDLDMRESLTNELKLVPLDYKVRDTHEYARTHTPADWWHYYWGAEPYSNACTNPLRRYATIYLKNDEVPK